MSYFFDLELFSPVLLIMLLTLCGWIWIDWLPPK